MNPLLEVVVLVDGGGDRRRRRDGFWYEGGAEIVERAKEVGGELAFIIRNGSEGWERWGLAACDCCPPLLRISLVDLVTQSSPWLFFRLLDRYAPDLLLQFIGG
jgi:hypothetical protein